MRSLITWLLYPLLFNLGISQPCPYFGTDIPPPIWVSCPEVWVDSTKTMSPQAHFEAEKRLPYQPLAGLSLAGKYQRGKYAYWFRFSLKNRSDSPLAIGIGTGLFEKVELYRNRQPMPFARMGTRTSLEENPEPVFPGRAATRVHLRGQEELDIWIRITTQLEINRAFDLQVFDPALRLEKGWRTTLAFYVSLGSFFVLLLFLSIFYLLQYSKNRDKAFLFYSLYLLSVFLFFSRDFDLNSPDFHLWPLEFLSSRFQTPLVFGSFALYMGFLSHFLEAREHIPKLATIVRKGSWLCLGFVGLEQILAFIDPFLAWQAYAYFKLVMLLICVSLIYNLLINRSPLAFYVLCGTLILVLSSLVTACLSFLPVHLVQWWDITYFPQYAGILLEILFFSLGLGVKSSQKRREVFWNWAQDQREEGTASLEEKPPAVSLSRTSSDNGLSGPSPKPEKPATAQPAQHDFLQRIDAILEKHLDDPYLTTELLTKFIGISRAQLHRKLKSTTGLSTARYIRHYRLKKAKEMLQSTDFSVSEIAWQTGFGNLSWFSQAYREEFGMSPRESRRQKEAP
ncbi:MAG: helix-turn-helix domain-containing protein [Bacteroidota bacterium]